MRLLGHCLSVSLPPAAVEQGVGGLCYHIGNPDARPGDRSLVCHWRRHLERADADTLSLQLSPSFTPTSVIRKMYESKEKSKEEPAPGKVASGDSKDDTQKASEGMVGCAAQESV